MDKMAVLKKQGAMMRPEDVAKLLNCRVDMVWKLCRQNRIPHIKMGTATYIPVDAYNQWYKVRSEEALALVGMNN